MRYGEKILFEDVSLQISGQDRISLVGSNGTGKSTMLKIINGIAEPDSGEVAVSKHTTTGYLPQEGINLMGKTLYEEVSSAAGDVSALQKEIEQIEHELSVATETDTDEYSDLLNEYGELQERFRWLDGYRLKSKIEKILKGLGFGESDFERLTDEFSGGWQMRIAMAKLLLNNPSILLLDEPTNHLDVESLLWFENYMKSYQGAIVLVSHDKDFLDNISKRTIEFSLGNVTEYPGNYSYYKKEKAMRQELLENQYENQQKYLKQQERFIERFRYKASKASAVQSRIKQLEKKEFVQLEDDESGVDFKFPPATHSGKIAMEIEDLTKSYDGKNNILENINLIIERGEKIALVGVNGAGKSTLTRIIAGNESYNSGNVKPGHLVDIKFYAQNQAEELNPGKTVLETMEDSAAGEVRKNLRSILGSFLFRGDDVFKKVKVRSGGEKSRLALAKMLIEPSNFMILDEPTNHLDMRSKDVLMRALKDYSGTVILVSHERDFVNAVADKIIEVKNKEIRIYNCTTEEYFDMKMKEVLSKDESVKTGRTSKTKKKDLKRSDNENKKRKTEIARQIKRVQKNVSDLENEIASFEEKIRDRELKLGDADLYKDHQSIIEITNEYNSLKEKLNFVYSRWESESKELSLLVSELEKLELIN
jgi:ATP-binding cassette subfamily F protein 3